MENNPLKNRFARIFALAMVVAIAYYKRDALNEMLQTSIADNNRLGANSQQIVIQGSLVKISSNIPFIRTVEYHSDTYNSPFVVYSAQPDTNMPISFCGAKVDLLLQKTTLDVLDRIGLEKSANGGTRFQVYSGEERSDDPEMFQALRNEIPYAHQGDVVYACKKDFRGPRDSFAPKDVVCHSVKILKVSPQISVQPVKMSFIRPGLGHKTRCGDVVSIEYRALDYKGKVYGFGTIENIVIGQGSLPVQIEQALLRIGVKGEVVLKMRPDKVEFVSFARNELAVPRYLTNLHNIATTPYQESTFILKRIS